jgi:hypothetical protein
MQNALIDYFNQKLSSRGRSLDGRVIWRLVWSPEQREKRIGEFSDFYGPIFLRKRTEVRDVPKYWHLGPRWVLERLTFLPPDAAIHRELISQSCELDIFTPVRNGTYEPIYVFQDSSGNPLPVTEWALDAIMHTLEFGKRIKLTDSDMREEYDKEIAQDARYFEDVIQDSGRSSLFAFENSVFSDSTKVYRESVKPDDILLPSAAK